MMNQDELTSGINGRLRSRKISRDLHHPGIKTDKRIDLPTDHADNDHNNASHLCPYCDKTFNLKPSLTKHITRVHIKGPNQSSFIACQYCKHDYNSKDILKHMVNNHTNHYFACLDCETRFPSTEELATHKQVSCENINEKNQILYKSKLRSRCNPVSSSRKTSVESNVDFVFPISCELKPTKVEDPDIENNITANVIIPSYKSIINNTTNAKTNVFGKAKTTNESTNFSFITGVETGQFLSRLGVIHRSLNNETVKHKDFKYEEVDIKFEKCFNKVFFSKIGNNVHENLTKFLDGSLNKKKYNNDNALIKRKGKKIILNTFQGFPVLLAPEQCFRSTIINNVPCLILPKHKSKFGYNESDKLTLLEKPINNDPHADNCIITAISKLDIWTQQLMRQRFEKSLPSTSGKEVDTSKNVITRLVRETEYKNEPLRFLNNKIVAEVNEYEDFPFSLGLNPSTPSRSITPATLSGEWARPRKYVCCACGDQSEDSKGLASHISGEHPNSQIDYCEIVGEHLQYEDVFRDLYKSSQSSGRNRPIRGSRECTKCKKSISFDDLHEHILECAGDSPIIRRKCRNRPFGVRRRRTRLPDNTIRKKMRKELRSRHTLKNKCIKPKYKRADIGDGETIRKMLADLPAKRHRMPMTSLTIHKKIEIPRNRLRLRQRISENKSIKFFKDLKINANPTKNHAIENVFKRTRNLRPKTQTSFIRRNPIRRSVLTKKEEPNKETPQNTISTSQNNENTILPNYSAPNEADQNNTQRNSNEQLSMNNKFNKINLNGSFNSKQRSSKDGSNNEGSWRQGSDDPNKSGSRNTAPPKVPLKHSIEKITENIHSKDSDRFDQNKLMDQPYITNYTQSTHLMSVLHKPLFEKETAVIKLDKPPLLTLSQPEDIGALQKNKLNKPRKGLNDCIAMLKNKLYEPIECTADLPSPQLNNMSPTGRENINISHYEDFKPAMSDGRMLLPAHINQSNDYTVPLDLSSKSLHAEENLATNLCIKEIKNSGSEINEENTDKSPIDLSFKQTAEVETLDLTVQKSTCVTEINQFDEKTTTNDALEPITHYNNEVEAEENVSQNDPGYSTTTEVTMSKEEQVNLIYEQITRINKESGKQKVGLINEDIVDILGNMTIKKRNTLLDALPEVLTETVKHLKLVVDSSSNEDISNFSSIATQTTSNSDSIPAENIDANKYVNDPSMGTLTEMPKQDIGILNISKDVNVIDLTSDDGNSIWSPIATNVDRKPVIIDPQSFRKQKSNEQTASLRAVRIKSSTDKKKSGNQITNLLDNTKKLQTESSQDLTHDITYNNLSTLRNNQFVIQHTDVHSTQRSNYLNSVITQPTLPSENNYFFPEPNVDVCNHNTNSHVESNDSLIPNLTQSPNNIKPTSNLLYKTNEVYTENKKSDSEQLLKQYIRPIVEEDNINMGTALESKLSPEKEIPLLSSTPKPKNDFNNAEKNAPEAERNDDDDPEDDVSLAVIVKQRQLKDKSVIINNDIRKSTSEKKNICQVKQGKHKKSKKNTNSKKGKELTHSIDDILQNNSNTLPSIKDLERSKCIYESVIRETRTETNEDLAYNNELTCKTQKQVNEHRSNKDINMEIKSKNTTSQLLDNSIPTLTLKNCKVSLKKISARSNEENNDFVLKQNNTSQLEEDDDVFRPDFSEISSTSNEFYVSTPEKADRKIGCTKKRKSKKNVFKRDDVQKSQQEAVEKPILLNKEIAQSVVETPRDLLTIDNNVNISKPEIITATVNKVENKTPMAKKQLIFSKMLLDEKSKSLQINNQNNNMQESGKSDSKKDKNDKSNSLQCIIKPAEVPAPQILNNEDNESNNNKSRKGVLSCKIKNTNTLKVTDFICGDKEETSASDSSSLNITLKAIICKKSKKKLLDANARILKSQRRLVRSKDKTSKSTRDKSCLTNKLKKTIKKELDVDQNDILPASKLGEENVLGTKVNGSENLLVTDKSNKLSKDKNEINDSGNEDDTLFIKDKTEHSKRRPMPRLKPKALEINLNASTSKYIGGDTSIVLPDNYYLYSQPSTSGCKTQRSDKIARPNLASDSSKISPRHCYSDSDDSLSDTPLRNYVGGSSKYDNHPNDSGINISISENVLQKKTKARRNTKGNKIDNSQLTEEQKSEQFMESFGFFSERKPRKSNLIAAKKIAETFHKAKESDEVYFANRRNSVEKPKSNEQKIKKLLSVMNDDDRDGDTSSEPSGENSKPRRKKKYNRNLPRCNTCKLVFRRPDNICRHILSMKHAYKVAEIELKLKIEPLPDIPNLLISFRKRLDKLKKMQLLNKELKKEGKKTIKLPSLADIVDGITLLHDKQEQDVIRRGLSRDEALFIDCCEMLKESHKNEKPENITNVTVTEPYFDVSMTGPSTSKQFDDIYKTDTKRDDDMDSITAQTIMESEEVRNLENDLISGFKDAAAYSLKINNNQRSGGNTPVNDPYDINNEEIIIKVEPTELLYNNDNKTEKGMVLDKRLDQVDQIDIFEDKFDKIKRKSRSAAAAKLVQPIIEDTAKSAKKRKKSVKKSKSKKRSKKDPPSTVPTKGALKGFDSVKVPELRSDVNSEINLTQEDRKSSHKKKNSSKKKKSSGKHLSYLSKTIDESKKEIKMETKAKEIDVYEFMDNEDTDMLHFRMTKRQEHYKSSIIDKPSTSKVNHVFIKVPSSSSGSDVDDFVYMSDDYVRSDNETEHSLTSCEVKTNNKRTKTRKTSSKSKRKHSLGKHAAVGKIFKNNAVRNKRKRQSSPHESVTVKTDLDQLFDSLLNNEPVTVKEEPLSPPPQIIDDEPETGVARQRARRKCTVGKQNILAETWSSESDTERRRPNSVESVLAGGRKKKSKRHQTSRRSRGVTVKLEETDAGAIGPEPPTDDIANTDDRPLEPGQPPPPKTFVEQHGWIVGDSHKKLVTMLANAKGRKRKHKKRRKKKTSTEPK